MTDKKHYAYSQMEAILMPIRPKWFMLIADRKKKIEFRKSEALYRAIKRLISKYGYALIYFYLSKESPWIFIDNNNPYSTSPYFMSCKSLRNDNGKVVARFKCYDVEEIFVNEDEYLNTDTLSQKELLEQSYLTEDEAFEYFGEERMMNELVFGCAIHISKLEIFDRPKELDEFYKVGYSKEDFESLFADIDYKLTKAPQNYCYVEVDE